MEYIKYIKDCSDNFYKLAIRIKGRSLSELGFSSHVFIYRAINSNVNTFNTMDYVTLSRKFAKEHAEHQVVIEEEYQHVLMAYVNSDFVFEAYNPGEYFYDGPVIKGKVIYKIES